MALKDLCSISEEIIAEEMISDEYDDEPSVSTHRLSIHSITMDGFSADIDNDIDDGIRINSVVDLDYEEDVEENLEGTKIEKPKRSYKKGKKFNIPESKQRTDWEKSQIEQFLEQKGGPTQCPSRYAAGAVPEVFWTES